VRGRFPVGNSPLMPTRPSGHLMTSITRFPRWLAIALVVLVVQIVVQIVGDPQPRDLLPAAVGGGLIILLIRGSRIAWVVITLGSLYQVGNSLATGAELLLIAGATVALCLVAPSSIRYAWITRTRQRPAWGDSRMLDYYFKVRLSIHSVARRLIGWDEDEGAGDGSSRPGGYGVGLWRFGIASLVLLFLIGVTANWQKSAGGHSLIVSIVGDVIWICYLVAQVTFIVLVVLTGRRYFARARLPKRTAKGE